MPDSPEETHGLGTFLFPRHPRLRIPMKNPSRSFYFVATLCLLLALGGIFMSGYYSGRTGRNDSLAELWLGLSFVGSVALSIYASVVYKKQKGNPDSPR